MSASSSATNMSRSMQWNRIETPDTYHGHSLVTASGRRSYVAWQQRDRTWSVRRYLNKNHLHAKVNGLPNWVDVRLAVDLAEQVLGGMSTSEAEQWFLEAAKAERVTRADQKVIVEAANRLLGIR